jgi:hypothetical protein
VIEFDEAGNETLNTSTLDQFEHTITIYVDTGACRLTTRWSRVGTVVRRHRSVPSPSHSTPTVIVALGLFTLCNAGVVLDHFGATAALILLSLLIGKPIGVLLFYKIANHLGFPAPLGVRAYHVRMIGLMGSLGLTVPTYQLTNVPICRPTDLPTYRPTDLPTYRPTDLPTNLSSHTLTYQHILKACCCRLDSSPSYLAPRQSRKESSHPIPTNHSHPYPAPGGPVCVRHRVRG